MPIIEVRVKKDTGTEETDVIRKLIKRALKALGIDPQHVTVGFIETCNPERLIITYWTRSAQELLQDDNANKHAEVVGQIVQEFFGFPVECLVAVFPRDHTGLYLTPEQLT